MNNQKITALVSALANARATGHARDAGDLMKLYAEIEPEPDVKCGADEYIAWCNMRTAICFAVSYGFGEGYKKAYMEAHNPA